MWWKKIIQQKKRDKILIRFIKGIQKMGGAGGKISGEVSVLTYINQNAGVISK